MVLAELSKEIDWEARTLVRRRKRQKLPAEIVRKAK